MGEVLKKHSDGRFSLSHKESGWWIGDSDHDKVKAHKGEQILSKLSIKNCEAIERGYDFDELADEHCNKLYHEGNINWDHYRVHFKLGFKKAIEILGDKKFSEEDMLKAYNQGEEDCYKSGAVSEKRNKYIQSLQQTEWEVEVVMENKPYKYLVTIGEVTTSKLEPKLDADGCLILKRK